MVEKNTKTTTTYSESATAAGCRRTGVEAIIKSDEGRPYFYIDIGDDRFELTWAEACALESAIHHINEAIYNDLRAKREGCQ